MTISARRKGKDGELEIAEFLRERGFPHARRGQQFSGRGDSPDVVGVPGVHVEVKRVEKGNLYDWMAQAKRDAKAGNIPVVMHRRSRQDWVAILPLYQFLKMVRAVEGRLW